MVAIISVVQNEFEIFNNLCLYQECEREIG